jgi:stage III sporulation protein SpoIIIAA
MLLSTGCLHRISVMRNKQSQPYGMTMRVGRAFQGGSWMLRDLLMAGGNRNKNILFLGRPGTGQLLSGCYLHRSHEHSYVGI